MTEKKVKETFQHLFGEKPELMVTSPGRINLIGEHTDYNGGWVLPAAIDKKITFGFSRRSDLNCHLHSIDFNESEIIDLRSIKHSEKGWVNYLLGVIEQFQNEKPLPHGFNVVFGGDVPLGAGLSSSAALEAGLAFAINEMFELGKNKLELIKLAQRAENEFVGLQCGIMDMFASVMGKEGSVIRLDCRSLDYQYFPFNFPDISIVLCDSGVKHTFLGESEYNVRRRECEEGIALLQKYYPNISTLRDVTSSMLKKHKSELPPIVFQRCKFVIEEIARVEAACIDLEQNNLVAFGKKMFETHKGLSEDYGVSCEELDFLVESCHLTVDSLRAPNKLSTVNYQPSTIYGSRMMGGGFGGCTINLVKKEAVPEFINYMRKAYFEKFNLDLKTYVVTISEGTKRVGSGELRVES